MLKVVFRKNYSIKRGCKNFFVNAMNHNIAAVFVSGFIFLC